MTIERTQKLPIHCWWYPKLVNNFGKENWALSFQIQNMHAVQPSNSTVRYSPIDIKYLYEAGHLYKNAHISTV